MGNIKSKTSHNSGDPQVQILNSLDVHEEYHAQHDFKINVLLAIVCFHLAITLYRTYKENTKKQALKAAKSIANIENN